MHSYSSNAGVQSTGSTITQSVVVATLQHSHTTLQDHEYHLAWESEVEAFLFKEPW